jgi:hypothetical protein
VNADGWEVTPHPVAVELTDAYHAEPWTPAAPTFFPPLLGRIDEAMRERLHDLYGGI